MPELKPPLSDWPTPAFVVDRARLKNNLQYLQEISRQNDVKIMLALKAFAMWHFGPLINEYLNGTAASGLLEARLAHEHFIGQGDKRGHLHTYAPAYQLHEVDEIARISDHVIFNSVSQLKRFESELARHQKTRVGLRINPEHSEVKTPQYDPCAPKSRLGATAASLADYQPEDFAALSGLHMHTLCELGSDALQRTVETFEKRFKTWLASPAITWLNLGGGHHITRPGYDQTRLRDIIEHLQNEYKLEIFLEPGEAIALETGYLIATVLDISHNHTPMAILDVSATAHMPDVLEMPYRPEIVATGKSTDTLADLIPPAERYRTGEGTARPLPSVTYNPVKDNNTGHVYRLGGPTCLAGDIIGDYGFDEPLEIGDKLVFSDMAHYSMVKTTHFNGVNHPAIIAWDSNEAKAELVREFGYEDYANRLS